MSARALCLLALLLLSISISGLDGQQQQQQQQATSGLLLRLRANRLRRPESCRDSLPRRQEELPALVVTGRVKEVYLAPDQQQQQQQQQEPNRALVQVGRVLRGQRQLEGADILVAGFNSTTNSPCPNYVKPNDTLILLLQPQQQPPNSYAIYRNNLLAMNLNNLERVNALANDEPLKRRGPIEDILCEARYCPYGRCKVQADNQTTSCHCPDNCPAPAQPVCGSDNATYPSECHLIREGCRLRRPLFVTKESAC